MDTDSENQQYPLELNLKIVGRAIRFRYCDTNEYLRYPYKDLSLSNGFHNPEKLWNILWRIILNRLFDWRFSLSKCVESMQTKTTLGFSEFSRTLVRKFRVFPRKIAPDSHLQRYLDYVLQDDPNVPVGLNEKQIRQDCVGVMAHILHPNAYREISVGDDDDKVGGGKLFRNVWLNYLVEKLFNSTVMYSPLMVNNLSLYDNPTSREIEPQFKILMLGIDLPITSELKLVRQVKSDTERIKNLVKNLNSLRDQNTIIERHLKNGFETLESFRCSTSFKAKEEEMEKVRSQQRRLVDAALERHKQYQENRRKKLEGLLEQLKQVEGSRLGQHLKQYGNLALTSPMLVRIERYLTIKRALDSIIDLERRQIANMIQWVSLNGCRPEPADPVTDKLVQIGFCQTLLGASLELPLSVVVSLSKMRDYSLFGINQIVLKPTETVLLFSNCVEIDSGVLENPQFEGKEEYRVNQDPFRFVDQDATRGKWSEESKRHDIKKDLGMCHHCKALLPPSLLKFCKAMRRGGTKEQLWGILRRRLLGIASVDHAPCGRSYCKFCLERWYSLPEDTLGTSRKIYRCPCCNHKCSCTSCIRVESIKRHYYAFKGYGGTIEQLLRVSPTSILVSHMIRIPDSVKEPKAPEIRETPLPNRTILDVVPQDIIPLPDLLSCSPVEPLMHRQEVTPPEYFEYFGNLPEPIGDLYPLLIRAAPTIKNQDRPSLIEEEGMVGAGAGPLNRPQHEVKDFLVEGEISASSEMASDLVRRRQAKSATCAAGNSKIVMEPNSCVESPQTTEISSPLGSTQQKHSRTPSTTY